MINRLDLRHEAPERQTRSRVRRGKTVMRDPETITSIVLHQTATPLPIVARQIRKAGGDRILAKGRRMACMPVHGASSMCGLSVLTRPFESFLNAANGFNADSLSAEIEGLYRGVASDPMTVPRIKRGKENDITDLTIDAARDLIEWMVEEGSKAGCQLKWIYAHRQSSPSRRSDPGEVIWRRVAIEFAVKVLGLKMRPLHTLVSKSRKAPGPGRAIPLIWDPENGSGKY